MKRRAAREIAFRLTYEMVMTGEFNDDTKEDLLTDEHADKESRDYIESTIAGIAAHIDELKDVIVKYAKGYELERIYKTDLAALYVACYELLFTDTPKAVVANEAVEIVKTYSDVQSYAFVNGILASVIKEASNG